MLFKFKFESTMHCICIDKLTSISLVCAYMPNATANEFLSAQ